MGTYSTSAGDVPAVFSTHEPVTNAATGALFSDGYPIGPVLDLMISQLPPTQAIERGDDKRHHQDWHDGVWIVPKDLGVSWSNSDNSGDEPTNQSGNFTKSGIPILMIRFVEPGKGRHQRACGKGNPASGGLLRQTFGPRTEGVVLASICAAMRLV